jgi:RNA ligase (TIGR02306 family)
MSLHEAKVIRIKEILPHPDPETIRLGIVQVWDYQVVVAKDCWQVGQLAVYIEPDTMVDGGREEFAFLNGEKAPRLHRIKAKRLRGTWSEGLLVPAPEGFSEDSDAWEALGLARYVPPDNISRKGPKGNIDSEFGSGGEWEEAPIALPFEKYDLENFKKFNCMFTEGEEVVVTEKIHGQNFKAVWKDDRLWVGSRGGWKKPAQEKTIETPDGPKTYMQSQNNWWAAVDQNPWIVDLCRKHPGLVFFGEIYGQVQDLKYGAGKSQIFLSLFDVWNPETNRFLDDRTLTDIKVLDLSMACVIQDFEYFAPELYRGPYSKEKILEVTDGQSVIRSANNIREGCVVRSVFENDALRNRKILKNVSNFYLERT